MTPAAPDPALERHRQRLEQSLDKLKKALRHWQVFSAEYEAFREELQSLPAGASRQAMLVAGTSFGGTVVDEKEVKALLGDKVGIERSVAQVIAAVGHRINYVQENITKVEKQLEQGESRLSSLLVVAAPDLTNEEGLPIMDIREELDEEDNIINATINGNDPNATVKAIDTDGLEKIIEVTSTPLEKLVPVPVPAPVTKRQPHLPTNKPKNPSPLREVSNQPPVKDPVPVPVPVPVPAAPQTDPTPSIVKIIPDNDADADADATKWTHTVPTDTPSGALLRSEMLKYNMGEIGAVVAEINLDNDGDYYGYEDSDDDDYDYDDEANKDEDDEDGDDEDEYGRTTYKMMTPALLQEMEALQRRIQERAEGGLQQQGQGKKAVRFAPHLDVAPLPPPPQPREVEFPVPASAANEDDAIPLLLDLLAMDEARKEAALQPAAVTEGRKAQREVRGAVAAVTERVLERSDAATAPAAAPAAPRKQSRFAAARAAAAAGAAGTAGIAGSIYTNTNTTLHTLPSPASSASAHKQPLISSITEREPPATAIAQAPDELDPEIHRREVAAEMVRLRTRMVQRQGGFVEQAEEEEEMVPVKEEEGEGGRRVSRFKAARLKG